jgi:hypothetical protein
MKNQSILSLKTAILIAAVASATALRAATVQTAPLFNPPVASANPLQPVVFSESAEAHLLRDAYRILATGDHDYKGHRGKAMHSVEAAGKLLGVDLEGDLKDHSPQALSDARLREAQELIGRVLNSAEVKGQKRVVKHLTAAVNQINAALRVR